MSDNIYKIVTAVSILVIAVVMVLGSFDDAEAGPILLPGDNAGIACGPNFDVDTEDGKGVEDPTVTMGCDAEVQVSFGKVYAGVNTHEGFSPSNFSAEAGVVVPLGSVTRLAVEVNGNSEYKNGMATIEKDWGVSTRIGIVF